MMLVSFCLAIADPTAGRAIAARLFPVEPVELCLGQAGDCGCRPTMSASDPAYPDRAAQGRQSRQGRAPWLRLAGSSLIILHSQRDPLWGLTHDADSLARLFAIVVWSAAATSRFDSGPFTMLLIRNIGHCYWLVTFMSRTDLAEATAALTSPDTTTAGGEKRRPRERILDSATELFRTQGIGAVGVEIIAELANSNKMTLYRHFGSKEELLCVCLRQHADKVADLWRSLEKRFPGDPKAAAARLGRGSDRRQYFRIPAPVCWPMPRSSTRTPTTPFTGSLPKRRKNTGRSWPICAGVPAWSRRKNLPTPCRCSSRAPGSAARAPDPRARIKS